MPGIASQNGDSMMPDPGMSHAAGPTHIGPQIGLHLDIFAVSDDSAISSIETRWA